MKWNPVEMSVVRLAACSVRHREKTREQAAVLSYHILDRMGMNRSMSSVLSKLGRVLREKK